MLLKTSSDNLNLLILYSPHMKCPPVLYQEPWYIASCHDSLPAEHIFLLRLKLYSRHVRPGNKNICNGMYGHYAKLRHSICFAI